MVKSNFVQVGENEEIRSVVTVSNNSNSTTRWVGGSICPNCGKPYMYVGDIFGNPDDYICACDRFDFDKPFLSPPQFPCPALTEKGWECPRCGRVYSPSTTECYHCNNRHLSGGLTTVE